jgi:hypothetical protein
MFVKGNFFHSSMAAIPVAVALCLFSSCAGKKDISETPPELPISDAALLEDSEKAATDVSDSAVFADLTKAEAPEGMEVSSSGQGTAFYQSIGGESLGRVAYTLYGKTSYSKKLLKQNPELKGVKHLTAEQKVFFDIEKTRPQPTYLTKDLLNRYPTQLAERLNSIGSEKGSTKSSVTVNSGDTLQAISRKLYGTSRYWPEIFLINYDKIQDYDKIPAGITLAIFEHAAGNSGQTHEAPQVAPAEEVPLVAPVGAILAPTPAEKAPPALPVVPPAVNTPAPVATQAEQPPAAVDPIPETPAPVAVPPAAEPVVQKAEPTMRSEDVGSDSANMRRILYVCLVALIAGAAFYFTSKKRKPKFDMLDMTAADTAERPKLGAVKDSQKHNIS